jgi:hypothetical protein
VNYNAYTSAYDKNGIACDDVNTSCTIKGSTVQGLGATNSVAQNGILAWGHRRRSTTTPSPGTTTQVVVQVTPLRASCC